MPAFSAAGIIGGSLLSGIFGRSSAKTSMQFQKQIAQSGHQWEVADLRKAGLNPILSGTGGPGAKASGGAMPPTPDFGSGASAAALISKQRDLLDEQIRGAKYKADIDGPEALLKEIARQVAEATLTSGKKLQSARVRAYKLRQDNVKAYKLKAPFKKRATPNYNRNTYGN